MISLLNNFRDKMPRRLRAQKHANEYGIVAEDSPSKAAKKLRKARQARTFAQTQEHPSIATSKAHAAMLSIPCPDPTGEELARDAHQTRALNLVRQERWDDLSDAIREADRTLEMTPGMMPVAELLAYGARSDVVQAAEHALFDRKPAPDAPLLRGVEMLEYVLDEHKDDYVIACIVAQAHMDIAWAWRGTGWDIDVPARNREAFAAHFDRAAEILESFCPVAQNSALLAATRCTLQGGTPTQPKDLSDRYEALIDLNPANPAPMRAMGNHLLPRWYGSYQSLELEARRTAIRTRTVWGAGGYTWVMFDAISFDDEACERLDLAFFLEGLRDILKRQPDPYMANLLAAYCANTIGPSFTGNDIADHNRAQIAACADWIVREYLTELHPMIWAHAAQGFDNSLRVRSPSRFAAAGHADAIRILTVLFRSEIAAGQRIEFTDQGPIAKAG